MSDEPRRFEPASLDLFFTADSPSVHLVADDPLCRLRVEPRGQLLTLTTPYDGTEPDVSGYQHVATEVVDDDEGTWSLLRVDATDMHFEAYSLLLGVVDSLQNGAKFSTAAQSAVANLKVLLASRARLSEPQQIGLIGELLVLRDLLASYPEEQVLDWWLGPAAEEHDFSFADLDAEVKTTKSERRRHMVTGTSQLQPTPGRPLWLVSIQITRAGGGAGFSLTSLVNELYGSLQLRQRFRDELQQIGWRDEDADLYETEYMLRSGPLAYPVIDDFPALTEHGLAGAVPNAGLIDRVSYRIDVTDLTPARPGHPLNGFLDRKATN